MRRPSGIADDEWRLRVDLAAAYRICQKLNLNEGICNHLTVSLPEDAGTFLCIPYGLLWQEVTPTNLLTIRLCPDGSHEVVRGDGTPEATAFHIHGQMHKQHARAVCVMHTHSPWTTALTCLRDPRLPMIHQNCLRFYGDIAYDLSYNGAADSSEEGERLSRALGSSSTLFHRSHGAFLIGPSIPQVLDNLYYLERAAEVVVKACSMQQECAVIPDEVASLFKRKFDAENKEAAELHFQALKRVNCPQFFVDQQPQGLASKLSDMKGLGLGIGVPASVNEYWSAELPEGIGLGINYKAVDAIVELGSSLNQYLTASISSWSTRLRRASGQQD